MRIGGTDFRAARAEVNGTHLHYVAGGEGDLLLLLPGWPRTWWQFHKVMPSLAQHHRVVAVDLRGMGESAKTSGGYEKKTMAGDIAALIGHLGHERADVVGEDIGAMVAQSLAAHCPQVVRRVVLGEGVHPGPSLAQLPLLPGDGLPNMWWFPFNQLDDLPEQLLAGRFRLVVDHLARLLAADPAAIDEESRARYAAAYDQPGAVRAANGWYQAFRDDAADSRTHPTITAPLLMLSAQETAPFFMSALGEAAYAPTFATIPGAGHYLSEERPKDFARIITDFLA